MAYDVHGVYPDGIDDLSKEAYQEDFIKEINPIICANNLKGNDYAVDFLQTTE